MLQRRSVAFVAILGLLPFVLAACSDATSSADPRTQTPLVRVATVDTSTRAERAFTGIVAARVQSDLGFRVPGKVLERLVEKGKDPRRFPSVLAGYAARQYALWLGAFYLVVAVWGFAIGSGDSILGFLPVNTGDDLLHLALGLLGLTAAAATPQSNKLEARAKAAG